jgi:hypothetical protein
LSRWPLIKKEYLPMSINPANATELATIACEVGAEVVEGDLRYQSGSWQLGDLDLGEYLDRYRDQRLTVILVPLGEVERGTFMCGICGFVMDELGECPRCKLMAQDAAREVERRIQEREQLFGDIEAFLEGEAPQE